MINVPPCAKKYFARLVRRRLHCIGYGIYVPFIPLKQEEPNNEPQDQSQRNVYFNPNFSIIYAETALRHEEIVKGGQNGGGNEITEALSLIVDAPPDGVGDDDGEADCGSAAFPLMKN